MNISDPEWLTEVKPLTAPCASSQVPGRVPAGPWVVPAPLEAGGQCWKTECGGEVAQLPGALDSGLSRTQREPREPPSDCCARQPRPGGLGGNSSAVSGRSHGEGPWGPRVPGECLPGTPTFAHFQFADLPRPFFPKCVCCPSDRTATYVGDKTLSPFPSSKK